MIYLPIPSLLEPDAVAEFHVVVHQEGPACRATIAHLKLDREDERVMLIFGAVMQAFIEWAQGCGYAPAAIVGDGGPEVLRLKSTIYALREELAKR